MGDWIEIFEVGVHNGEAYTEKALDEMIANFGAEGFADVPLVISHDETGEVLEKLGIAKGGLVAELKREGRKLFGRFKDVHTKLAQWVKDGLYSNISVEIKPTEKGLSLFRVALLGGEVPAVPGLEPITALSAMGTTRRHSSKVDTDDHTSQLPSLKIPKHFQEEEEEAPAETEGTVEEKLESALNRLAQLEAVVAQLVQAVKPAEETPAEAPAMSAKQAAEIDALKTQLASVVKDNLKRSEDETATAIQTFVDQAKAEHKVMPAEADELVKVLMLSERPAQRAIMQMVRDRPVNPMFAEITETRGGAGGGKTDYGKEWDGNRELQTLTTRDTYVQGREYGDKIGYTFAETK